MSGAPAILALDLGTSSLKALLVDRDGRELASARHPYPTTHAEPCFAEQDPEAWWRAAVAAVAEVRGRGEIVAIAITGQMHGTLVLDAERRPLAPAIIWTDARSTVEAARLTERIGATRFNALAGSPLSPGFQAATLAWLRDRRPEVWQRCDTVALPKDWLAWRLTGTLATEPSDAAGTLLLDSGHRTWSAPILEALELDRQRLPPILTSGAVLGTLSANAARALALSRTTPVILAGGDAPCAAIAGGASTPDRALVLLSTGAQVIQTSAAYEPDTDGRLHVWPSAMPGEPMWNRMGATLNAGLACEWLARLTGESVPTLLDLAAAAPASAGGPLFLPYLIGERTPLMDTGARGSIVGLHATHGPADLARAVAQGIAFALSEALHVVVERAPRPTEVLLGGGARHPLWPRLLADTFGVPVRPLAIADLSALGAAMLAAHHLDWLRLPAEADQWHQYDADITPDPTRHAHLQDLFQIHREAH